MRNCKCYSEIQSQQTRKASTTKDFLKCANSKARLVAPKLNRIVS